MSNSVKTVAPNKRLLHHPTDNMRHAVYNTNPPKVKKRPTITQYKRAMKRAKLMARLDLKLVKLTIPKMHTCKLPSRIKMRITKKTKGNNHDK